MSMFHFTGNEVLSDLLADAVDKCPQHTAMVYRDQKISYAELFTKVKDYARGFIATGIKRGDTIALILPTRPEFMYCWFAANSIGAIVVALNMRYLQSELQYTLSQSRAKIVITLAEFGGANRRPLLADVQSKVPTIERVLYVDETDGNDSLQVLVEEGKDEGIHFEELPPKPETGSLIIYTSGSTGKQKAALLTHRSILSMAWGLRQAMGVNQEDRIINVLPLDHVGGATILGITMLSSFATLVLADSFRPDEFVALARKEQVTIMGGVPTMFVMMLSLNTLESHSLSSLRLIAYGGAPASRQLLDALKETLGCRVMGCYGLTEVSGFCTTTSLEDAKEVVLSTVGRPIPGAEIRIVGQDGKVQPQGQPGEVQVRGNLVIREYFRMPEATDEAFVAGWLKTGDVGIIDHNGNLAIVGRIKDMYISGGYNVYPAEIEECLTQHPKVAMAAVVGVEDAVLGEVGFVFVVPKGNAQITQNELKEFCNGRVADFKVPRYFDLRSSLPLTPLGKVQKLVLKMEAEELLKAAREPNLA